MEEELGRVLETALQRVQSAPQWVADSVPESAPQSVPESVPELAPQSVPESAPVWVLE